jgi:hypothetical protein
MREWPEIETHNGRSTFAAGTALHVPKQSLLLATATVRNALSSEFGDCSPNRSVR